MVGPETLARALEPLTADLGAIFGARLRSVVVYDTPGAGPAAGRDPGSPPDEAFDPGPALHTLVLVDRLGAEDLEACARRAPGWRRRQIAAPLLLTVVEFERSLDAFPLEYGEIIARHVLVSGEDLVGRAKVVPEDLRRACEVQAKSHLLHLREGYLESGGEAARVAELVAASARPFEALLGHVARLQGAKARTREELAQHAAEAIGLAAPVVARVIGLLHPGDLTPSEAARLFPAYLEASERLATFVDGWTC
jgi:hypothetical protein